MNDKRLNVVSKENKSATDASISYSKNEWRQEMQAKFERMWLVDPEQFNPLRNCLERERLEQTWKLMESSLQDKLVADLACGGGVMAKRLKEAGARVHALDIASIALEILRKEVPNVDQTYHQCLPRTTLEDDAYDWVLATEVIAYLPSQQLRLFMSELCRLVKPNGYVICSTGLDLDSQDPLLRFASLAETEFKVHQWVCGYHRLYIRLKNFFCAPDRYARASKNPDYRQQELQKRKGFNQSWFRWNTQNPLAYIWKVLQYIAYPFAYLFRQNRTLMLFLEKICRLLWGEQGISHAIFIASRRPLQPLELPKDQIPVERKGKRQVWE